MLTESEGVNFDVDRGPDWLFVKLQPSKSKGPDGNRVADRLLSISNKHFIYRLVLELDELNKLPSGMMGQIVMLQERLEQHGGALKLCGLSPECEQAFQECHLDKALPNHVSREDAVLGDACIAT